MHLSALLIRHLFSPLSSNNGILANAKNLGYFAFGKNLKKTTFCPRQKSGRDANLNRFALAVFANAKTW
jgi:hypothetical protein